MLARLGAGGRAGGRGRGRGRGGWGGVVGDVAEGRQAARAVAGASRGGAGRARGGTRAAGLRGATWLERWASGAGRGRVWGLRAGTKAGAGATAGPGAGGRGLGGASGGWCWVDGEGRVSTAPAGRSRVQVLRIWSEDFAVMVLVAGGRNVGRGGAGLDRGGPPLRLRDGSGKQARANPVGRSLCVGDWSVFVPTMAVLWLQWLRGRRPAARGVAAVNAVLPHREGCAGGTGMGCGFNHWKRIVPSTNGDGS